MRVVFQEVSCRGIKAGKCLICGKYARRQERFTATVNPFNKNSDGTVRSREQVSEYVKAKRQKWLEEPIKHAKC